MSRKLSIQALAAACARHPWRTIGAWVAAVFVALVAITSLLSLTTEANPTNDPQSQRASDAVSRAFPASAAATDLVVVRSRSYTIETPQFRALVRGLASDIGHAADVASVRTYLGARDPSLVSSDRHAAMTQFSA